jgi:hypothetical protein
MTPNRGPTRRPAWPWVLLGGAVVTVALAVLLFPWWSPVLGLGM